jgi:hypothetical protein
MQALALNRAGREQGSLLGCEGFRVESRERRLGVVETVLLGESTQPSALSVRRGRFGRGVRIIDAGDIERIDERARSISVRSDGVEIRF